LRWRGARARSECSPDFSGANGSICTGSGLVAGSRCERSRDSRGKTENSAGGEERHAIFNGGGRWIVG
jgi:hypothetical protein